MGPTPELVPPPTVTVDTNGPVGAAIAGAMNRHLDPASPGAAPGGARPAIVIVEPGPDGVTGLAERLAAATRIRGQRVWVIVTGPEQVVAVDDIVEGAVGVDALVLVDSSHPASAGAALAAWTWLRHDAPSMALGGLRDSSGRVCRVATVIAQAPAEPPASPGPAPAASFSRAEQRWLGGLTQARTLGLETAGTMLNDSDLAAVVGGLESAVAEKTQAVAAQLVDEVHDWGPGELRWLLESAEQLSQGFATDDGALTSAAVAMGKADAALAHETARTGLSGIFGRRKRIADLTQSRDRAWEKWCVAVTQHGEELAQHSFAAQLATALPEVVNNSEIHWQQSVEQRTSEALARWLATTAAAAQRLQPPQPTGTSTVPRTWGSASPQVRRHLLVPTAAAVTGPDELDDAVGIHSADGLQQPLAVAWLLGLSAASFESAQAGN